jgi:hypothetical protein
MKIRINLICACAIALLAGPVVVSHLRAQSSQPRVENRLLLIFDTSSAMKKRLPNEEKGINELFELTLNGKLRRGDSVGVWTFGHDLHLGVFPQLDWSDDKLSSLPIEIGAFLKKQRYAKDTRFDVLMPTLNEVVRTSPRLTTIIFCDGDGQVSDIPGTEGINASFKQHQRIMEKARMPFVIVLRSQFDRNQVGHYVGCTIGSAQSIVLPGFPPMPLPLQPPQPTPVKELPQAPPPVVPSLIVVGTHTETNLPPPKPEPAPVTPAPRPVPAPAPTLPPTANPVTPPAPVPQPVTPPPAAPVPHTNSVSPPAAVIEPTNAPVVASQTTPRPAPPAAVPLPAPPENSSAGKGRLLAAGAGLLIAAIAIIYFVVRRSRSQNSTSLITESLKKR